MPGLNRTGPTGQGPRTGRTYGRCRPENKSPERKQNARFTTEMRKGCGNRSGHGWTGKGRPGQGNGHGTGMRNRLRDSVDFQ